MPQDADPILDTADNEPTDGIGLCLSGGGYRAMVFHIGALWRLAEARRLKSLTRISSVSGGSITAAVLALAWDKLTDGDLTGYKTHVVTPLRDLASTTIDRGSILGGLILPGGIGEYVARAYDKHLFKGADLQALPDEPRFIINATNLETGVLWRFSKRYMADYRVGMIDNPKTPIADAVAASSAFPPLLSPFMLDVAPSDFDKKYGDLPDSFRRDISLTDGGVYDNLGLQQVWGRCKTVFVSDGGGHVGDDPSPAGDWARQSKRIFDVVDNQVRSLRKIQVVGSFKAKRRIGAYWGIRTDIADYELADALACPHERTMKLAEISTRLKAMSDTEQERLINWGYAVTDAGLRKRYDATIAKPAGFPYPGVGVG